MGGYGIAQVGFWSGTPFEVVVREPKKECVMPVSALVVTLSDEPVERAATLAELAGLDHLTVGDVEGRVHVPVVCESESLAEGEERVRELMSMRGVVFVDVVMVDFSDLEEINESMRERRLRPEVEWEPDLLAESDRSER